MTATMTSPSLSRRPAPMQEPERVNIHLSELSRRFGLTTRVVKYLEEIGLLDTPRRVGNASIYLSVDLAKIQTIAQLRAGGVAAMDIAALSKATDSRLAGPELERLVRGRIKQVEAERAALDTLLAECVAA